LTFEPACGTIEVEVREMRVRVGSKYRFHRAGWDLFDGKFPLDDGAIVKVVNLPGAPPANTMGHAYIVSATGDFLGLVSTNSLTPLHGAPS
jgi:hypothetical protein